MSDNFSNRYHRITTGDNRDIFLGRRRLATTFFVADALWGIGATLLIYALVVST